MYSESDPQIQFLFAALDNMKPRLLKRFLFWLTGCVSIPPENPNEPFRLLVDGKGAADRLEHLPTVSACYNLLHLPPYPNQLVLEQKLTQAVRLADVGFHYERGV